MTFFLISPTVYSQTVPDTLVNGSLSSSLNKNKNQPAQNVVLSSTPFVSDSIVQNDTTSNLLNNGFNINVSFDEPSNNGYSAILFEVYNSETGAIYRSRSEKSSIVSSQDENISSSGQTLNYSPSLPFESGYYKISITFEYANKMTGETVAHFIQL